MKKITILLILAGIMTGFAPTIHAEIFDVDTAGEFQAALTTAESNGEDDTINVAVGTYTIGSTLMYGVAEDFAITISGADRDTTILDGNNANRIFSGSLSGHSNAPITIEGLTFQNGISTLGGAILIASNSGGATIKNCNFFDNSADNAGAVATEVEGNIVFTDNVLTGNAATDGDVGAAWLSGDSGSVTVTGNRFSGNTAVDDCGGVYAGSETGAVTFSNNNVTNNSVNAVVVNSGQYGGVYLASQHGPIAVNNNTISDNSVTGIAPFGDDAGLFAGIMVETMDGAVRLSGNRITGNTTNNSAGGGAVQTESADIYLANNIIAGNTAGELGGGFGAVTQTGTVYVVNNTITGNTATNDDCGGLYLQLGEDAGDTVAAIAHIYNNIIWSNSAAGDGADLYVNDNEDADTLQGTVDLHFNDFSDLYFVDGSAATESDNIDQDPDLTADLHLPATSLCVDAGDNTAPGIPAEDIDDDDRIVDGDEDGDAVVDMGADEYVEPEADVSTAGIVPAGGGGGGGCFISSSSRTLHGMFDNN
ncbi:MAG: right-handed parallel beta-helix repeat-containing protein [Thermodesulfobacteriota bacterium]|nr:right-handed parallel beta-helix repeat-containing protein [Thermodesulfobacteriota bacterium]